MGERGWMRLLEEGGGVTIRGVVIVGGCAVRCGLE